MKNKYYLYLFFPIITGALSQPLLAYSYILLGDFLETKNGNISLIIALIICSLTGIGIYHFLTAYIKNNFSLEIKKEVFSNVLLQDLSETTKKDYSEYINLLNIKLDKWRDLYITSILAVLKDVLQTLFLGLILFKINKFIFICMSILLLPLFLNNTIFPKIMNKKVDKYFELQDKKLAELTDIFNGINVIKNTGSEKVFTTFIFATFDEENRSVQSLSFVENVSGFFSNTSVALSQIGGVILASYLVTLDIISVGAFLAVLQISFFLNEPIISMINNYIAIKSMKSINEEIREFVKCEKSYVSNKSSLAFKNIKLNHLNYIYEDKNVFKDDIKVVIEKGKKYMIRGESGSGKSTLGKILLKILPGYTGSITLNDKDYASFSESDINCLIENICQDTYIFNNTLRFNIDILSQCSDEEILEIIDRVNLNKLLNDISSLDVCIDMNKREVSGGEKSRIAIARALVAKKQIVIADEILANLDAENSLNIENILLSLEDITLIHIAHKPNESLVDKYDHIIEL
ncbi:ATP-binding cassette domain-containing protein [Filifactor villosus]|uniref:ATP-binding cassette domain-containing protein n=1 Tax=Filifactor villosus TaxID=29374 RepID=A0ABV9QL57_9FIRM